MSDYTTFSVPVEDGSLFAARWGEGDQIVLCSHGVTANHTEFHALADQFGPDLSDVSIVAVDHRGRAASNAIEGPWGIDRHADDLAATLDHLGLERADVVLGHSMGGFVAAVFGARHPKRTGSVLLVDGGLPLMDELPEGMTMEQIITAIIGPAMERLDLTFESRDAYLDYWREHPAIGEEWSEYVEEYLDYDLVGEAPTLRASTRKEAVIGDTESMLATDLLPRSLVALERPVRLLRAQRGMLNEAPLYADERIETWAPQIADFTHRTVDDVNHYTIMLGSKGAGVIADEVRRLLG